LVVAEALVLVEVDCAYVCEDGFLDGEDGVDELVEGCDADVDEEVTGSTKKARSSSPMRQPCKISSKSRGSKEAPLFREKFCSRMEFPCSSAGGDAPW
jgi:hypothetical protein